jgi:sulfane dehydrogenase subunit SoxC
VSADVDAGGGSAPESTPSGGGPGISRRTLLAGAAGAAAGGILGAIAPARLPGQGVAASAPPPVGVGEAAAPVVPGDPSRVPGIPSGPLSVRSPFEAPALAPVGVTTGSAGTPLQALSGTTTPSDLVFQRHHNGIALVDPARYALLVHGLVDRPTSFSLEDLRRLPAVTRVHFLECAGNGRSAYRSPKPEMTPQDVDGLTSNCEWTGVPLATLLREVGVRREATWLLAEGGDAAKLARSVPMEKAVDDALVAYAQNGEALRAANGYPVRLLLPGYEGNMNVKWLRRLELGAEPWMFRDETSKYTDPLPDGTARRFSFVMDAKSIITAPAHPDRLPAPGWWPVRGLAWTGRGRIARVDVSADGGGSWTEATLVGPVLPKAHTRFELMWRWDGRPARLMSRAVDETGYVQPTIAEYRRARGAGTDYHFNAIRAWDVRSDGRLFFAVEA